MGEDSIETVTVTATRLPPLWLYAALGIAFALALGTLLRKQRR